MKQISYFWLLFLTSFVTRSRSQHSDSHSQDSRGLRSCKHVVTDLLSEVHIDSAISNSTFFVELNGTKIGKAKSYRWQKLDFNGIDDDVTIIDGDQRVALARVVRPKENKVTYKFQLTAMKRRTQQLCPHIGYTHVHYEEICSAGLHMLATKVVQTLLEMKFEYIRLSHEHRKNTCHHPNVAAYFRSHANDCSSILDEVTKYVLEKQATEDAMSDCATDYVEYMMKSGFNMSINVKNPTSDVMISTFRAAYDSESNLAKILAMVNHLATNKDAELAKFVAHNLLKRVTKTINRHKSIIETALRGTESSDDRYITEFLFDKHLVMSS